MCVCVYLYMYINTATFHFRYNEPFLKKGNCVVCEGLY